MVNLYFDLSKPPIPIKPNIDFQDHPKVELTTQANMFGGEKRKAKILTVDRRDTELLLRTINEFEDACKESRLNITQPGRKFAKFRECLDNEARDAWDEVCDGKEETEANFTACISELIVKMATTDEPFDHQLHYMSNLTKPHAMRCADFKTRLSIMQKMALRMPNSREITDRELKSFFIGGHPTKWQASFYDSKQGDIGDQSWVALIQFFQRKKDLFDSSHEARRDGFHQRRRGRSRDNSRDRNSSSFQRGKRFKGNDEKGRTGNQHRDSRGNGKVCEFHPNDSHSWYHCFGNPNGPNYKPGYRLPPKGGWSNSNKNQQNKPTTKTGNHDAHLADDDDDNSNKNHNHCDDEHDLHYLDHFALQDAYDE